MKECGICYETKIEKFLPCGHSTCHECYEHLTGYTCPYCRAPFREPPVPQIDNLNGDLDYWIDYANNSNWSVYSHVTRYGTEIIRVYNNSQIPSSWRNNSLRITVKPRRFGRRIRRRRITY